MRDYLAAMDAAAGRRELPPRFLGARGPQMTRLVGNATDGLHTCCRPVAHTAAARDAVGAGRWIAPTQLVAVDGRPGRREDVRSHLKLCLDMPNYRTNLRRFGFAGHHIGFVDDQLADPLVVLDAACALTDRLVAQRRAGADHAVVQFVAPPPAAAVLDRVAGGLTGSAP